MAVSDLKNPGSSEGNGSFWRPRSERPVNYQILRSEDVARPISSGIMPESAMRFLVVYHPVFVMFSRRSFDLTLC